MRASAARRDGRGPAARRRASPRPERDADLLLAHVLDVALGRLPLVDDLGAAEREAYDALVARRAAREPLQHLTGTRGVPPRRAGRRAGRLRAPPRDRAARRVGDRAPRGARPTGGRRRPLHRLRVPSPGRSPTRSPAPTVHAVELDEGALAWAERNLAGTGVDLRHGDLATRLRRPARDGRRRRLQPALHPARGLGVGRRRGARPRPPPRPLLRPGRARRDPGAGAPRGRAAAARGSGRCRARRRAGGVRARRLRRHRSLDRRRRPPRPRGSSRAT